MIDSFITADRLSSQAGSGPIAGYSLSPIVFLVTDLIATLRIKRFYGLGGVQPVGVAFRVDFISSNSSNHATAILLKSNLTALGLALSPVPDDNNPSPSVCQQFFLDQLVYNDKASNPYSDAHYTATTIGCMTDSLIHLADKAGREKLVEIFGTKVLSTGTNGDLERICDKRV
ncbi:hypothetical protein PGT21_000769 [Puccinia graminis f. sp. tritici]|uniref:Uncharacterized protein n=1 Tax=Puccinia graminis f. sp. tritici TaxID=56615 RepID=A0A5B0MGD9_PUCGR|nr:hypothetical protein PGT21_000769 [Puccinia graminis f. sp. tritici]